MLNKTAAYECIFLPELILLIPFTFKIKGQKNTKYLTHQILNRPLNTKLIYYVGDFNSTGPFYKAGVDLIDEKDVESYMTGKPKKTVGKPAVTKEEANGKSES